MDLSGRAEEKIDHRFENVRNHVASLGDALLRAARGALPSSPRVLGGEVLEAWRTESHWELVLRDVQEDRTLFARLPCVEEKPAIGYTIGLEGHYAVEFDDVDASMRLVFQAERRARWWQPNLPRRIRARLELVAQLQKDFPEMAWLKKEPSHIVLVTSFSSASIEDFKAGLGDLAEAVRLELVRISLDKGTAADIAAGVREAGAKKPDLIVLMRGGGRRLMLEKFSAPEVLQAVAEVGARTPVVVAVGHEKDRVDAEEFAWKRASTPQGAGHLVASQIRKFRWLEKKRAAAAALASSEAATDLTSRPKPTDARSPVERDSALPSTGAQKVGGAKSRQRWRRIVLAGSFGLFTALGWYAKGLWEQWNFTLPISQPAPYEPTQEVVTPATLPTNPAPSSPTVPRPPRRKGKGHSKVEQSDPPEKG